MAIFCRSTAAFASAGLGLALLLTGCDPAPKMAPETSPTPKASGSVSIDGSDTVYPVTSALVEQMTNKGQFAVSHAGTGAGMQKFINGEIDICDASRPINADEVAKLKEKGTEFYEIAVAYDGVAIIVNAKNTGINTITKDQLHKIWDKDSKVKNWNEIDPAWPSKEIKLYGPTTAHGTYEFFNEAIHGDKKNSRGDYSSQAQYDALITNVSRDEYALGYVGYAYAKISKDVKILKVDAGKGAVAPDDGTIMDGTYAPLSRPLLMYIGKKAYDSKQSVKDFIATALDPKTAIEAVKAAGYVPLPNSSYDLGTKLIAAGKTGSHLLGASMGSKYEDVVAAALK